MNLCHSSGENVICGLKPLTIESNTCTFRAATFTGVYIFKSAVYILLNVIQSP